MDVDEVVVAHELRAPQRVEERLARDHDAGLAREQRQQVELEGRQVHGLAVHADEAPSLVDLQACGRRARRARCSAPTVDAGCRLPGARPPEQGLDPGHDLARREGLHEVVVRAHREAHDPVDLLAAGREHQHVGVGEGAQPPADLDAVEARQHDVEDDDVGVEAAGGLEGGDPVAGALDDPALALEVAGDQLHDGRLVVDDQDPVGAQLHPRSVPPARGGTRDRPSGLARVLTARSARGATRRRASRRVPAR